MTDEATVLSPRLSKTCDHCKGRKVRCIVKPGASSCTSCSRRKVQCRFSHTRRLLSRDHPIRPVSHGVVTPSPPSGYVIDSELYIDHLLQNPGAGRFSVLNGCPFKIHDHRLASSNLAFFSEYRIRLLSNRLGHNGVRNLVDRFATVMAAKPKRYELQSIARTNSRELSRQPYQVDPGTSATYINAYFDQVHPLYPFLDRKDFEQKALAPGLKEYLSTSHPFSALYHAVLALGCQCAGDQSFDPRVGEASGLFQVALGLLPDVILLKETLLNLQAITAMGIFALNMAFIPISETISLEGARMAQALGIHRVTKSSAAVMGGSEVVSYRTFWVIYLLERQVCFLLGRSPALTDYDIGSPIPPTPESHIEGFDSFIALLRLSRLSSKAYQTLFSVTATMNSPQQYITAIDSVRNDLHKWKASIPTKFRPDLLFYSANSYMTFMLLRLHYTYHALVISVCKFDLHIRAEVEGEEIRMDDTKKQLMDAARTIIKLIAYVDIQPYTPMWILGTVPLSAMFVLFDLVIHHPTSCETEVNLSMLDIVAGYFGRLDYATGGIIPASILSGFTHIANQYVKEYRGSNGTTGTSPEAGNNSMPESMIAIPQAEALDTPEPAPLMTTGLTPEGLLFQESLSYPMAMVGTEGMLDDDLLAGFDFTNIFDTVIPDFSTWMY